MKEIEQVYPKPPSPCNCLNIRRAARAVTQFYDAALAESGLTIAQLGLLAEVAAGGSDAGIGELSARLRIDRTTINRNVKPLIESGFVEIVQGKDLRRKQLRLTSVGHERVILGYKCWNAAQESLGAYLGRENLKGLTELLSKLEALAP